MAASRTGKKVLERQERVVEQIAQGLLDLPADQIDHLSALRIRYRGAAAQDERDAIRLVAADVLESTVARLDLESLRREEASRKRVGQNIKRHRQALGLTQQALGVRAGLAQAYICRLERGLHVAREPRPSRRWRQLSTCNPPIWTPPAKGDGRIVTIAACNNLREAKYCGFARFPGVNASQTVEDRRFAEALPVQIARLPCFVAHLSRTGPLNRLETGRKNSKTARKIGSSGIRSPAKSARH